MKARLKIWWEWAKHRQTVIVNVIGILIIIFGFVGFQYYQSVRSIDVLKKWNISIIDPKQTRKIDNQTVAVYNPGDSLIFESKSTKIVEAQGSSARLLICEETATQKEVLVQLDTVPAVRPAGDSPKRANAVTVPDVTRFQGLPRWCKLVINISYVNVLNTGRNQPETAESQRFLVEEAKLDAASLRSEIKTLNDKIKKLESQLPKADGTSAPAPSSSTPSSQTTLPTTSNTTTNNSTTNNTTNNPSVEEQCTVNALGIKLFCQ